jgi:hypothetical protein
LAVAQKVAQSLFAKYIRIALATFRKFDDSFGYAVIGVKTAPVSLNSRASHFECNAHGPRRFRIKLLIAKKWCDWHDSYPLALSFSQATKRASVDGIAKRCVRILRPTKDRPKIFVNEGGTAPAETRPQPL